MFGEALYYEGGVSGVQNQTVGGGDYHHVPGDVIDRAQSKHIVDVLLELALA